MAQWLATRFGVGRSRVRIRFGSLFSPANFPPISPPKCPQNCPKNYLVQEKWLVRTGADALKTLHTFFVSGFRRLLDTCPDPGDLRVRRARRRLRRRRARLTRKSPGLQNVPAQKCPRPELGLNFLVAQWLNGRRSGLGSQGPGFGSWDRHFFQPPLPQLPPKFAPKSPPKLPKKISCSSKMAGQNMRRHPQNGPHFFFSAFSGLLDATLTQVPTSPNKSPKVPISPTKSQKVSKSLKKSRAQKIISRKKCAQCLGKCTVVQQNDIRHPSAALGCTLGQKNRPSGAARPRADFLPSSAPSGLHWGDGNGVGVGVGVGYAWRRHAATFVFGGRSSVSVDSVSPANMPNGRGLLRRNTSRPQCGETR